MAVEDRQSTSRWLVNVARNLAQLFTHPVSSFRRCPEPVEHGKVLGFLSTLRLPPWLVLLVVLGLDMAATGPEPIAQRAIHQFLEPPLVKALSGWIILMIPVGMPLLYFFGGVVAHMGIGLTGGASRSIGASMRAVGFALGPALLAIAFLDIPLYTGRVGTMTYLAVLAVVGVVFLVHTAVGLAMTHQVGMLRSFMVALLPLCVLLGVTGARAALELPDIPGVPAPEHPYYVP